MTGDWANGTASKRGVSKEQRERGCLRALGRKEEGAVEMELFFCQSTHRHTKRATATRRVLVRAPDPCPRLILPEQQCDEILTFCKKKFAPAK